MREKGPLLLCFFSLILLAGNAVEACEYVDVCSSCTYTSIQDAIDYYVEPDCSVNDNNYIIRVARGTYVENIEIIKCKNITIEGGWDATFSSHSNDPSLTVIEGTTSDSGWYDTCDSRAPPPPACSLSLEECCCLARDLDNTDICLSYCTAISPNQQECNAATRDEVFHVDPRQEDLTLTIKDVTIQKGVGIGYGGGMFAETTQGHKLFLILQNNEIKNNFVRGREIDHDPTMGPDGGGLAVGAFNGKIEATLKGNKIHNNSAKADSGGVLVISRGREITMDSNIELIMQDNNIYENEAAFGVGISLYAAKLTDREPMKLIADLSNNTISNNHSVKCGRIAEYPVTYGGGILINALDGDKIELTLNNNTIEGNASAIGSGIAAVTHARDVEGYRDSQIRLMSENNQIINNEVPDAPDCIPANPHTGDAVTIVSNQYLTEQSVFTFDNDFFSNPTVPDLALESDDLPSRTDNRDSVFIGAKNSTIGTMKRYYRRDNDGYPAGTTDLTLDISSDDFNDGNDDEWKWTQKSGTWGVQSGEYVIIDNQSPPSTFSVLRLKTQQEMTIEADTYDIDNKFFFVLFTYNEDTGKAYWAGASVAYNTWIIEEIDIATGVCNPLASLLEPEGIDENQLYNLKVDLQGDTVRLYAKRENETDYGDPRLTYTFPGGMPVGNIGLGGYNSHTHFDNFSTTLYWPAANPGAPLAGCPVRIGGTCYSSLQEAYDAAVSGNTVQSQSVRFMEDLYADHDKSVNLEGGYDCDYTTTIDKTRLNGHMDISDGADAIENFVLE